MKTNERSVQVNEEDAKYIILGLERLQAEARKFARKTETLEGLEKVKKDFVEFNEMLEALKTRFL